MEKEKDSFFGTESPRSEISEDAYSSDDASTISAASSRSRSNSESSVTSVSSKSSAASDASSVSKASSKSNNSNKSSASEAGETASLVQHSASEKGSTASLIDHSSVDLPPLNSARSEKSNSESVATSVNSVREVAAAGDSGENSVLKERSMTPVEEVEPVKEVTITKPVRPKSAHPSRARRTSTTSSTKSVNLPMKTDRSLDTEQHRQRMLLSTGKSSKDVSHLLEAVLVMDQKESQMQNKPSNFTQPRMPSAKTRSNYKQNERQREIQTENARLLAELTKNRRPQSATSLSGRSTRSARSINSAFSTASSTSRYSTNFTPIARNYHSKINRDREAKRIDQENLAFLRRLNAVKASPHIRSSRNAVTSAPALRSRPKSMRPTVVNTWQDGW